MSPVTDLVTVYRSMDATAKEDCETIVDTLDSRGITAVMVDDSAPGVPEGTFEVRVAAADVARAETIIAENPLPDEVEEVDNSSELDLETIYHSEASATSEIEAIGIKNVLEASGIAAILVGTATLPNLGFEIRVARENVERAKEVVAEAQRTGAAGALEAELESEPGGADSH